MFGGLFIVSLIFTCVQVIKESLAPKVPAENWANKELYHQDMMNGVSSEQLMKNVQNGRYRVFVSHPEPHRTKDGKIIIENYSLYEEDVKRYGTYQAYKWSEQGRYNLTTKELNKEHERLEKEFEYMCSL